jgi:hypothetical protein
MRSGLSQRWLQLPRRHHAACRALAAITNPTVNLQAHQRAAHALGRHLVAQHRHLDRQQPHPHGARARARAASSCACPTAPPTPICCRPVIIAAGLDGIANAPIPASGSTSTCTSEGHTVKNAPKLPLNLLDALRAFEKDKVLRAGWAPSSPTPI